MEIEWIDLNLERDPDDEGWVDAYDGGINQEQLDRAWTPGNLLRALDGDIHLVGDVNPKGGKCDCCHSIQRYEIKAYATPFPYLAALIAR